MNNAELIAILSSLPQDAQILAHNRYGSSQEVVGVVYDSAARTIVIKTVE